MAFFAAFGGRGGKYHFGGLAFPFQVRVTLRQVDGTRARAKENGTLINAD